MRVLHVSTDFKAVGDDVGYGGVERHVLQLARLQVSAGKAPRIITTTDACDPLAIPLIPAELYKLRFRDEREYLNQWERIAESILDTARDYDIIHDHMGNFLSRFSNKLDSKPSFLSCYAQPNHYAYQKLYRECARHFSTATRRPRVVASSHRQRVDLQKLLDVDYVVYPIVADCPDYTTQLGLIDVCLAGVRPDKCQLEIIEVCKSIHQPLLVAGPLLVFDSRSRDYAEMVMRAVDINITAASLTMDEFVSVVERAAEANQTIYVGELKQAYLEVAFGIAKRLVLLNRTEEVFSTVVMEAMKRGIPCIVGPYASAWESTMGLAAIVNEISRESITEAFSSDSPHRTMIRSFSNLVFDSKRWEETWDILYNSTNNVLVTR